MVYGPLTGTEGIQVQHFSVLLNSVDLAQNQQLSDFARIFCHMTSVIILCKFILCRLDDRYKKIYETLNLSKSVYVC